jgi:hypothetical protein
MHSEFACHIGLRGKFFCRVCWVKGSDAQDSANMPNINQDSTNNSPAPSNASSNGDSINERDADATALPTLSTHPTPATLAEPLVNTTPAVAIPPEPPVCAPKRKKFKESMTAMLNRVSAFIKV